MDVYFVVDSSVNVGDTKLNEWLNAGRGHIAKGVDYLSIKTGVIMWKSRETLTWNVTMTSG
jgi:hypothetical protein